MQELISIRKKIDILDKKLVALLEKRLLLCQKTIKYKTAIADKKREQEILNKIDCSAIKEIYQSIFKISKKLQKKKSL